MARATSIAVARAPDRIRIAGFSRIALGALIMLPGAALAGFTIVIWKFNGLYGQDPYAYYGYAVGPLRHTLLTGAVPTAMFWPVGYPLPVAFASLLVGPSPASAQLVSLIAGMASVGLTYLLALEVLSSAAHICRRPVPGYPLGGPGRHRSAALRRSATLRLGNIGTSYLHRTGLKPEATTNSEIDPATIRTVAIISALLVGLAGRTIEAETTAMADAVALCAALLSAYALVRWLGRSQESQVDAAEPVHTSVVALASHTASEGRSGLSIGWAAVSGTALGWAIISRWGMAVLVPVWAAAMLPVLRVNHMRALPSVFAGLIAAGAIAGAQVVLVLTVKPVAALGRWPFLGDLSLVQGGGWSPANLLRHSFFTADGAQQYALPNLAFYGAGVFHLQYLTPLWLPAVVLGVAAAWRLGTLPRLLLIAWPAIILLFAAGLPEQNARFILPALPSVAILAGLGLAPIWRSLRVTPVARHSIMAIALLVVAGAGMHDVHRVVQERGSEVAVATWVGDHVPQGSLVIAFEITGALASTTGLRPYDLADISESRLRSLVRSRPVYLLVRPSSMEGQWRRRPPGMRMARLARSPGLIRLGSAGGYTLFRTRSP